MGSLRILQITNLLPPYVGGAVVVDRLSSALTRRGHHVVVFTADPRGLLKSPQARKREYELHVYRTWDPGNLLFCITPGMIKDLISERYDIVHLHMVSHFPSVAASAI